MYQHTYIFKRRSTGSVIRVTDYSERRDPAVYVMGFDEFEISATESRRMEKEEEARHAPEAIT